MRVHSTRLTIAALACVLTIVGCRPAAAPVPPTPETPTTTPSQSAAAYRTQLVAVLAPFFASRQTTGITQQLLALTVPPVDKDLHLKLVLAFSQFDAAREHSDADAAAVAFTQMQQLRAQYPWIAGQ